jgi:citrate synthase
MASGLLLGGGSSLAVQAWLSEIDSPGSVSRVLGGRLRRGDRLSGFGQPRYRDADPRAELLMELLLESPGSGAVRERLEIVRAVVDLVPGEAVFVIARSAGWIAHAAEEYATGPRARQRRD